MRVHDVDLLTAFVDDELPPGEREAVLAHLRGCAACRDHVRAERRIKARLAGALGPGPDPGLPMRLLALPERCPPHLPAPALRDGATVWSRPGTRMVGLSLLAAMGVALAVTVSLAAGGQPDQSPADTPPPGWRYALEQRRSTPVPTTQLVDYPLVSAPFGSGFVVPTGSPGSTTGQ